MTPRQDDDWSPPGGGEGYFGTPAFGHLGTKSVFRFADFGHSGGGCVQRKGWHIGGLGSEIIQIN